MRKIVHTLPIPKYCYVLGVYKVFGTVLRGYRVEKFIYPYIHINTGDENETPKPKTQYLFILVGKRKG